MKFSEEGGILGVGALGLGRLFLLLPKGTFSVKVAAMIQIKRRVGTTKYTNIKNIVLPDFVDPF